MSSDNHFDTITKSIEKYLGLPALIIGFVVDVVALLAVFGAQANGIGGGIFIGPVIQLTIWTTAIITYIGYLRGYWKKQVSNSKASTSNAWPFTAFILDDLPRLRYPFLLIPFVILIGFFANILINHPGTTFMYAILIALVVSGMIYLIKRSDEEVNQALVEKAEWNAIILDMERWKERISSALEHQGFITDLELSHVSLETVALCRKAMISYFQTYRSENDLVFIDELIRNIFYEPEYLRLHILAYRSLSTTRPWMLDTERYFRLKPRWL